MLEPHGVTPLDRGRAPGQRLPLQVQVARLPFRRSSSISWWGAKIDDNGRLMLKGYFDTTPSRVNYDLDFVMSDGEWKLIRINVDVKKPEK